MSARVGDWRKRQRRPTGVEELVLQPAVNGNGSRRFPGQLGFQARELGGLPGLA